MKITIIILVLFSVMTLCTPQTVQIIDDWYYIDGKKFFVKGIGYETHTRPGQVPWVYSFDTNLINFDLQRIKVAGYNTIRTWGALTEEELQLVESSGLKILYGIWIDPHGDFGNPDFKNATLDHFDDVLAYSTGYDCIIGYIIMNEPQVQHIYDTGAESLSDLWQSVITLIHDKHPGIPVSFSNTMIGDYINMEVFDFAAYNAYIYNPVTITGSHGYAGYLSFIKENRSPGIPMIITEFGLSVSPGGSNPDYGYGGNTLDQQVSGNLLMYRELIDAGTQGGCVFQYHDGWWKGGNEYVHDPVAEEYFGLIEFSGVTDKYGTTRPVWQAFGQYNKAIITRPQNGSIYNGKIPLEFFLTDDVTSYTVTVNDSLLSSDQITDTWYSDTLIYLTDSDIQDLDLNFIFFDSNGDTLKSEQIVILYSRQDQELPQINLEIIPDNLVPGGKNFLKMTVTNNPVFDIRQNEITYVSHPHIGFDIGDSKSKTMEFSDNSWSYLDNFYMPVDTKVATFGAGFTIEYGKFSKVISNQKIMMNGDWADPIAAPELATGINQGKSGSNDEAGSFALFQNYPNPFNPETNISFTLAKTSHVVLEIFDVTGQKIQTLLDEKKSVGFQQIRFRAINLSSGVYFYRIQTKEYSQVRKMIHLR